MKKFTPGPWKLKFKKNSDWTVWGPNGYNILAIPHDDDHGDTPADKANACLIAAAPDLLEALESMRTRFCECPDDGGSCDACNTSSLAIAKAQGGIK